MKGAWTRRGFLDFCKSLGADVREDYPFHDHNWAVMRHWANKRGFAFLYQREGKLWVNVKCDPQWAGFWRDAYPGVTPGYHMNKAHWNSVLLDGSVPEEAVKTMVGESYRLTLPKRQGGN